MDTLLNLCLAFFFFFNLYFNGMLRIASFSFTDSTSLVP